MPKLGLRHGAIGPTAAHLCIDVQNLFLEETLWHAPWLIRMLPVIEAIAKAHAVATIFTRLIPPFTPELAQGMWLLYYQHWRQLTLERIDPKLIELAP